MKVAPLVYVIDRKKRNNNGQNAHSAIGEKNILLWDRESKGGK